ncbi:hypothetical protein [Plantactinospora sp. KBS50]|uniref:hypothetical protein n=1 Tax=Plantactinospora sp. KBS50 TaxID=2024580 RepID=UPI000BAAB6A5|nr:hypothetical protein [Plantactinospora sp. KBS50]ASW56117.1 hypothetical protein CIK06_20990 [Plantactinospora sp. KBS50]
MVEGNDEKATDEHREIIMFGLSNEEILLEMHTNRLWELRRHADASRLARSAARTRHGTRRSWLRGGGRNRQAG